MLYLEPSGHDPALNLALEQTVFDCLDPEQDYCMLWQNDNAVIVGKHQNTFGEINRAWADAHGVKVVRRLSGGGAVYHDLGNINFTFIAKDGGDGSFDFATFCRPVVKALAKLGVPAEVNGRNDITVGGRKFSGNSQYMKRGRVMHHGTILYDSNLEVVQQVLNVPRDKLETKGFQSVKSRVTNLRPLVKGEVSTAEFLSFLRDFLFEEYDLRRRVLTPDELAQAEALKRQRYDSWDWNYGQSPAFALIKERRVERCGKVEVHMDAEGGRIERLAFYGDYFGNGDTAELAARLIGCPLEAAALHRALDGVALGDFFNNIDAESFVALLLQ